MTYHWKGILTTKIITLRKGFYNLHGKNGGLSKYSSCQQGWRKHPQTALLFWFQLTVSHKDSPLIKGLRSQHVRPLFGGSLKIFIVSLFLEACCFKRQNNGATCRCLPQTCQERQPGTVRQLVNFDRFPLIWPGMS